MGNTQPINLTANATLVQEVVEAARRVGQLLSNAQEADGVLAVQKACKLLGAATGADIVAVREMHPDGYADYVAGWARTAILDGEHPRLRVRSEIDFSEPILAVDPKSMPIAPGEHKELARWRRESPRDPVTLFCPLRSGAEPLGFVCLVGTRNLGWDREVVNAITLAALLIGQFQLRIWSDQIHTHRLAISTFVRSASHAFFDLTPSDLNLAIDRSIQELGELLGATSVSIWHLDHDEGTGERLHRWHTSGVSPEAEPVVRPSDIAFDIGDLAAPTAVDVPERDHTIVFAPGFVGSRPDVCVAATRKLGHRWVDWESAALASFADLIAVMRHKCATDARLAATFSDAPLGISLRTLNGRLLECNRAYLDFLGVDSKEGLPELGLDLIELESLAPELVAASRHRDMGALSGKDLPYRRSDGTLVWGRVSIVLIGDDQPVWLTHVEDVTSHRQALEQIHQRASTDSLTGLANRHAITETLENILSRQPTHRRRVAARGQEPTTVASQEMAPCAAVILDLDGFKSVNDQYGHPAGDRVLIEVGRRLTDAVRPSDLIGRYGGDEFLVVLIGPIAGSDAVSQIERLRACFAEPFDVVEGRPVTVGASVGAAIALRNDSPGELLARADRAMYAQKPSAGSERTSRNIVVRTPDSTALPGLASSRDGHEKGDDVIIDLRKNPVTRDQLAMALERGIIDFWGQPIIHLPTGKTLGVELLARWPQSDGSIIGPSDFIPLAEETGLVVELGRQALAEAARHFNAWRDDPDLGRLGINVNISPQHLAEGLIEDVHGLMAILPPSSLLGIELIETSLAKGSRHHLAVLRGLRDRGIRVVIDDFGIGQSSLSRLHQFPASSVKLDKSFVDGIAEDPERFAFLRSIADVLRNTGLPVTAEGIESKAQLDLVRQTRIVAVQGFHFARPAEMHEVESRIRGAAVIAKRKATP